MTATIVTVNGLALPAGGQLRREPRRPPDLQQAGFSERFDHATLCYDAFAVGSLICLSGPPLLNLRPALAAAGWTVDGLPLDPGQVILGDIDRTQRSWLDLRRGGGARSLAVTLADLRLETPVSADGAQLFAGRNVLVTLSKNNDPAWIHDWIVFHRDHHSIDAVLLYDNGSDAYTLESLREALATIAGVDVTVVPWNYPYGPLGVDESGRALPWDSDFCQYGMLEHAKVRFLRHANLVINADVDELLLCHGGEAISRLMDRHHLDVCRYAGHWIENLRDAGVDGAPRHGHFAWINPALPPCEFKWSIRPTRVPLGRVQWRVHDVQGMPATSQPDAAYRHFAGITTGWLTPRKPSVTDTSRLRLDAALVQAMTRSFGASATFATPDR